MLVDLGKAFSRGETEKVIEARFDFSGEDFGGRVVFEKPVCAALSLRKIRDDILVSLKGEGHGSCVCDRCLERFTRTFPFSREYLVTPRFLRDEDVEIPVDRRKILDFRQFVYSELSLRLPSVILCEDDCPGLCPVCGRPLREGCDCSRKRTVDPRLAVLQQLLDNDE